MRRTHGRVVEVESLADLDARLAAGASRLRGWRVHGLDLRERGAVLRSASVGAATFLGCTFAPGDAEALTAAGALVLPVLTSTPLDVYRARLYTADELYDAPGYADTLDARGYAWSQQRRPGAAGHEARLAASLHDHAVDTALAAWVRGRRLVGVMGGHAVRRGDPGYADAVHLGAALGAHHVVATGGGPGAMEAANLGGRFTHADDGVLDEALRLLSEVASFTPSVDAWVASARAVLALPHRPADTLGVPTWHYGHEPPNLMATAIAKYVGNAVREAVLLEVCDAGIVFLPGAGGTVQEVFQDACENYYADEGTVAPMVLVGRRYWTDDVPAWPLLQRLARGRPMEPHVHLVDSVADAAAVLAP